MSRSIASARRPSPLVAVDELASALYWLDREAAAVEPGSWQQYQLLGGGSTAVALVRAAAAVGVFATAPALLRYRDVRWLWGPCTRCARFTRLEAVSPKRRRRKGQSNAAEEVRWACGGCSYRVDEQYYPSWHQSEPTLWELRRDALREYAFEVPVAGKKTRRRTPVGDPARALADLIPALVDLDVRAEALERWTPEAHQLLTEAAVVELVRACATRGLFPVAPVLLEAPELRRLWGPCPRCRRYTRLQTRTGQRYLDYAEWSCDKCFPAVRAAHGGYVGSFGDGAPW